MTLQSLLTDPALAGAWTLEPERSSVRFTSRTLWGLIPVNGRFTGLTGEGTITPENGLTGRLVIRADTVRTGIGMRDRHLRAADFFDAANHPDIVVNVTATPSSGQLDATLTIRGTTLAAPMRASLERQGADCLLITARGEIDRTRWGVSGNILRMMPPDTALAVDAVFVR